MKSTIETNLRRFLRPVVVRRQRLLLLQKLIVYWLVAALAGLAIVISGSQGNPVEFWVLMLAVVIVTAVTWYKSPSVEPDYKAIARSIEKLNPELKAVLLTAVEQKPQEPDGQYGFLQERVIGDAITCAKQQKWTKSVPNTKLGLAIAGQAAAVVFFILVLSRLEPSISNTPQPGKFSPKGYAISVSPGDANVEMGFPVVITARFDELLPGDVSLMIGTSIDQAEPIPFEKNLQDPLFGAMISKVNTDMYYHIEYDGRRTRDYKLTTFEYPSLQRADVNIISPAYTNLPEKTIKDTRQFSVAEGSKVTMYFTLNKPVSSAQLVAKDGTAINLDEDINLSNILTTSFMAEDSNKYVLKLVDADGRKNKVSDRFTIDVHKNMPAQVSTVFPNRDIEASAIEEISLEAKISDDYGLMAYGVNYNLSGTWSTLAGMGQSILANKELPIKYTLSLEPLNAEPDQLLTYYFWAEDIGPDGKTRRSVSDLYFAEIRPFEEIFRQDQSSQSSNSGEQQERQQRERQQQGQNQQQQQTREQLIQLQKQILTATWNIKRQAATSKDVESRQENLDLVRQSQAEALRQARSSGRPMDSEQEMPDPNILEL
jgi:hypothetical protein